MIRKETSSNLNKVGLRIDGAVEPADSSSSVQFTKRDAVRITTAMLDPLGLIAQRSSLTIQVKIPIK